MFVYNNNNNNDDDDLQLNDNFVLFVIKGIVVIEMIVKC